MASKAASSPTQTARKKKIRCPKCEVQFVATLCDGQSIECPACEVRIAVRSKKLKQNAPMTAKASPDRPAALASDQRAAVARPVSRSKWLIPSVAGMAALVLGVAGLCACSHYSSVDPSTEDREWVQGVVSCDGKTVSSGVVVMKGEDGVLRTSPISPDGAYVLPIPHGKARVAVVSWNPSPEPVEPKADDKPESATTEPVSGWFPLPEASSDVDRSGIEVMVDGEMKFDIELHQPGE